MAIHSLMSTRSTQGAIAWLISLLSFPFLAVPLYFFLGRNRFDGYVSSRQASSEQFKPYIDEMTRDIGNYIVTPSVNEPPVWLCRELCRIPVVKGNALQLLVDGDATFDHIIEGLRGANHYVLFQFFIIKDDGLGRRIRDALIDCSQRGVKVYLLFDEVGSYALDSSYLNTLNKAGVKVATFNKKGNIRKRFQVNFRNHRKNVVIDGNKAWLGGHNVGDEYLGKYPKFGHWRDTHMCIEGPAVKALQLSFLEDWNWAKGEILDLQWEITNCANQDAHILVLPTGPADELESAKLMFVQCIRSAKSRIWITSPYFVPDEAVIAALQLAALKGIDIRILIPDKPDHYLVYLTAFAYIHDVSPVGVKFYRYSDGFLHQKVMLIDDDLAAVGTANLDNRSFRLNFELTAIVHDVVFAQQVKQMLEDDFSKSQLVANDEFSNKPWYFQLLVRIARLSAPVL
ncbi:cardiolipin synthase [Alginatibacterium sediminis]|uniref:Cardiolipin synthase n=2 Tax=Alginatibacterium sediminis TaxID=2164068 RepID=A0A420EIG0_9ALTE|nr:cardiolipin synthase [Alginatibacterium sediminis]